MGKVAVGGTFDIIHKGHRRLLQRAAETGERLVVGLTADEMLAKPARPYRERRESVEDLLKDIPHEIIKLQDPLGPAVSMEDLRAIVVSEETRENAVKINEEREGRGLAPLEIIAVPMVLADDGIAISSTRVREGEIDTEGRLLDRGEQA